MLRDVAHEMVKVGEQVNGTRCSNHPWTTSSERGQKMKVSKEMVDSQMKSAIGKSKEL